MTNGEMQQALILAFELLCHAAPDQDLDDGTWTERCDKWLDTYPPSKVGLTDSASGGANG